MMQVDGLPFGEVALRGGRRRRGVEERSTARRGRPNARAGGRVDWIGDRIGRGRYPILMLVVAAVTRVVVGRALALVEAIRSEVQTISGDRLDRRVPVPPADDEIAHLATTMNTMLDRLEEGRDRQRRLVSDASHELRSPIAAIRQHVEVALAHPEESDGLSWRGRAGRGPAPSTHGRGPAAPHEDRRGHSRPPALAGRPGRHRARRSDPPARRRHRDTGRHEGRLGMQGPRRRGTPRAARAHLTDNAIRHARRAITVSLYQVGDDAVLTIDDDGSGVPMRDQERIFERFERLDEARDRDLAAPASAWRSSARSPTRIEARSRYRTLRPGALGSR